MILSNVELFAALDEGRLIIRPEPRPRLPMVGQAHSPYDTHSVDLTLGNEITVPRKGQITYDLTKPGSIADTARIEGKSSRARFGILIHFTAPTVHRGFRGTLTLEMINLGPASFMLKPGMAIAQLIVEEVKGCPIEKPSQFQGQQNPAG